jgi:hypothetical protein
VKACRSDTSIESLSQNSELMLQTSARQRKRIEVKSLEALKARLTRRLSGNAAPVEKSPEPMVPKLDIVQDATFTICTDLRDFSHIQRDIDRLQQHRHAPASQPATAVLLADDSHAVSTCSGFVSRITHCASKRM